MNRNRSARGSGDQRWRVRPHGRRGLSPLPASPLTHRTLRRCGPATAREGGHCGPGPGLRSQAVGGEGRGGVHPRGLWRRLARGGQTLDRPALRRGKPCLCPADLIIRVAPAVVRSSLLCRRSAWGRLVTWGQGPPPAPCVASPLFPPSAVCVLAKPGFLLVEGAPGKIRQIKYLRR